MNDNPPGHDVRVQKRSVETAFALRVECGGDPGDLSRVLSAINERDGGLASHILWRRGERAVAIVLCEKPEEAALAAREAGLETELESVVTIRTDSRPGATLHLSRTLDAAGIGIEYSFAMLFSEDLLVVLRTVDNPKAEDVLRAYLCVDEPGLRKADL